jgi:hypothetical protein
MMLGRGRPSYPPLADRRDRGRHSIFSILFVNPREILANPCVPAKSACLDTFLPNPREAVKKLDNRIVNAFQIPASGIWHPDSKCNSI